MDAAGLVSLGGDLITWGGFIYLLASRTIPTWRFSARKLAARNANEYREMVRRMEHGGEFVAYAAQRVTVSVLGIAMMLAGPFITANSPPLFALIGNSLMLVGGAFLIAFTGDELIRLANMDAWKCARLKKVRKYLGRAGLKGEALNAELFRLIPELQLELVADEA